MAEKTRTQDTIFIDMKYIVLYRKLGFKEVESDIFVAQYGMAEIRLEAEAQRFFFNGDWHQLLTYKDMVKLECMDRLLKKGYAANAIAFDKSADLTLLGKGGGVYVRFLFEEWGRQYEKLQSDYIFDRESAVALYTSQLSGGLIDYKTRIYTANGIFERGLVEPKAGLYATDFHNIAAHIDCTDSDFIIKADELIKYIGASAEVVVPFGITKIGTGAFWNNTTVESIRLPESVTCVAGDAFVYCDNLKRVNIPINVEVIGDNPFAGCPDLVIENASDSFVLENGVLFDKERKSIIHYSPLKADAEYTIPESVEWIGKHSFYKCLNLKRVTITKNVAYMGNNAFSDCLNIALVNHSLHFHYEGGLLYNGDITQVFHYSLGSGVKRVVIKDGVRTLGRNSFWNARTIETITIPETVRQIGYNPFAYCINAEFIVKSPAYTTYNGVLYTSDFREAVCCTTKAAQSGTVVLHEKTESLGRNAFTGCETVREIILPRGLKSIARGAFSGCMNLTEIDIPKSVEFLGDWAFNNCTSLKTVRLPHGLKVEPNTFKNCEAKLTWI
jgi:hypothetical protein